MEDFAPMVMTVTLFVASAMVLVTYMENRRRSNLARMQADLQMKLLDKFGSVPELMQYLQTESGQRFLAVAPIERTNPLLWLAYVEGFSHAEIAEVAGLKSGSIRPLLFRARQKLATLLHHAGL